ncbi:hypothetical protein SAMN04488239_12211 [Ruegeria marina]|uniref:Uncharacterized protein n=1 Tax=Ruegeria marina TaxID=639004 RepID=A0A1G7DQK0_9RHOB|nr:hypothetical protein SAMN04488239_12211 [Ruegeria marina]
MRGGISSRNCWAAKVGYVVNGPELPSIVISDSALRPVIPAVRPSVQHFRLSSVGRAGRCFLSSFWRQLLILVF